MKVELRFMSRHVTLTEEQEFRLLQAVADLFPLRLEYARGKFKHYDSPADFRRADVPKAFCTSAGDCRVPLRSSRENLNVILFESTRLDIRWSSMTVGCDPQRLGESDFFEAERVVDTSRRILETDFFDLGLSQIFAKLYDANFYERRQQVDRRKAPVGLFWFNYFPAVYLQNIGSKAVEAVRDIVYHSETVNDGLMFLVQEELPTVDDEGYIARVKRIEDVLDWEELPRRFPWSQRKP